MPRYHRLSAAIWNEPWDDDMRLAAFYLLTCPHRTTEGLFKLPLPYVQADMGWLPKRIEKTFTKLEEAGFIRRHEDVVLIRMALKYQSPQNANQVTAALTALETVPETPLDAEFGQLAKRFSERLCKGLLERFGERFGNALALTLAPTQSPSPSPGDGDEEVSDYIAGKIKRDHLKTFLLNLGYEKADVLTALERFELRNRFGEPIVDPAAWLRTVLQSMVKTRSMEGNGTKLIELDDGTRLKLTPQGWEEVEAS